MLNACHLKEGREGGKEGIWTPVNGNTSVLSANAFEELVAAEVSVR